MKTKLCIVEAMFPELRGGSIYKTGKGRATSNKAAISRAFADVLHQVSKRRIHTIKATITITESRAAA